MTRLRFPTMLLAAALAALACASPAPPPAAGAPAPTAAHGAAPWAPDAVCYEIFVRSFADGDGDGVGDLPGLIARLDYLNDGDVATTRDLGVSCLWLMPIAASPGYHGYDVSDYYRVQPAYGTNADFQRLVREAHARGIRVIVDLVLNHVSSEHPWFQAALRDAASPYREWFRFRPTHPGVKNPWGGDNWHRSPLRDEWYYAFFWQGMPDLNFGSAAVRAEANRIADFWLGEMGADGFRLDAVSFLVEEDDRRVQHTAGTHAVLRAFGGHVRAVAPGSFTIGEVWDSTSTLSGYYPDQLDAYFAFELSDSLLSAVRTRRAAGLTTALARLEAVAPAQRWGSFLRNHDQERTLGALGGDRAMARTAATLLLTLPGTPFVYYGEEIGMRGGKNDPDGDLGIRTPMQWAAGPGAGFTSGTPWQAPRGDRDTVNVAAQDADARSLLAHYRRLVRLRTATPALSSGDWAPLTATDPAVAAWLRRKDGHAVLVVVNLAAIPVTGVALSAVGAVVRPGRFTPRTLLGEGTAASLHATAGRIERYVPLARLGAGEGVVLQLY